jgi:glycosyltransferase involved in cell wall biosynthesis
MNNEAVSMIFLGHGPLEHEIKEISHHYKNIHFHNSVTSAEVTKITASADVGITITDYSCKNHLFSLPNKFFDYIQAGIPIIGTDLVNVKHIIQSRRIGIVINQINQLELQSAINIIIKEHSSFRKNFSLLKDLYRWENEETKLLHIYKQQQVKD